MEIWLTKKKETKISGSKWTVEEQERKKSLVLQAYEKFLSINKACKKVGIHPVTFYRWMEQDPSLQHKINLIRMADIEQARTNVSNAIRKEAETGETTNSWRLLERRDPDFKEKKEIEHTGEIRTIADLAKEEFDGEGS